MLSNDTKVTPSLGVIMDRHRGVGPGFDFLRIFLASSVLLSHSVLLTGHGRETVSSPQSPFYDLRFLIMPAFFALSGFLVAGSIFRVRNVSTFMMLRGLRIYPALIVEIVLSVFLLGFIVSDYSLVDYIKDKKLWLYIANISGLFIHYELPGVFQDNPFKNIVNGSLWTVPAEMKCYISLAFLMASGLVFRTGWLLATLCCGCLFVFLNNLDGYHMISTFSSNDFEPSDHIFLRWRYLIHLSLQLIY